MKCGYVAGPMRGLPNQNFPAFLMASNILRRATGLRIFDPAQMDLDAGIDPNDPLFDIDKLDLRDIFRRDLVAVSECTAVYLLPGWEQSWGAFLEVMLAVELGLKLFEVHDLSAYGLDLIPITYREVYVRTWFLFISRALPQMRLVRQLGKVRGWLRKVLWSRLRALQARRRGTLQHIPRIPATLFYPDDLGCIPGYAGGSPTDSGDVREVGLRDRLTEWCGIPSSQLQG